MAPRRGRKRSKGSGRKKQPPADADAQQEVIPSSTAESVPATWTTDHHLVGTTTSRERVEDALGSLPIPPLALEAFLPEDPSERRPALWRSILPPPPCLSGPDGTAVHEQQLLARALDCVAADLQQQQPPPTAAALPSTTRSTQPPLLSTLQSRWADVLETYCQKEGILSSLLVMGALEVVLHNYVQQQARLLAAQQEAPAATSASTSTRSIKSPPAYYRQHPNQYLVQPVAVAAPMDDGSSPAAPFSTTTFTLQQVLQRVKTGLGLAWQRYAAEQEQQQQQQYSPESSYYLACMEQPLTTAASSVYIDSGGTQRRSSRRVQQVLQQQAAAAVTSAAASHHKSEPLWAWKVVDGGRIAKFVTQHCCVTDDDEDKKKEEDADKKEDDESDRKEAAAPKEEEAKDAAVSTSQETTTVDAMETEQTSAEASATAPATSEVVAIEIEETAVTKPAAETTAAAMETEETTAAATTKPAPQSTIVTSTETTAEEAAATAIKPAPQVTATDTTTGAGHDATATATPLETTAQATAISEAAMETEETPATTKPAPESTDAAGMTTVEATELTAQETAATATKPAPEATAIATKPAPEATATRLETIAHAEGPLDLPPAAAEATSEKQAEDVAVPPVSTAATATLATEAQQDVAVAESETRQQEADNNNGERQEDRTSTTLAAAETASTDHSKRPETGTNIAEKTATTLPPVAETSTLPAGGPDEQDSATADSKDVVEEGVAEKKEESENKGDAETNNVVPTPAGEPTPNSADSKQKANDNKEDEGDSNANTEDAEQKSPRVVYKDDYEDEDEENDSDKGGDDDQDETYATSPDGKSQDPADDATAELSLVAENAASLRRSLTVEMIDLPDKNDIEDATEEDLEQEQPDPAEEEEKDEEEDDENVDVVNDRNPYLKPSPKEHGPFILEWLGVKTAKNLTMSEVQDICSSSQLVQSTKKKKKKAKKRVGSRRGDASGVHVEDLLLSPLDCHVMGKAMSSNLYSSTRFVFHFADPEAFTDTDFEQWETSFFGKTPFTLQVVDDDADAHWEEIEAARLSQEQQYFQQQQAYKEQKAWDTTRYRGIHGGFTIWPSWLGAVEAWSVNRNQSSGAQDTSQPAQAASTTTDASTTMAGSGPASQPTSQETKGAGNANVDSDFKLAQALANQDEPSMTETRPSSRRTTRRAADGGVFYGNQSSLTQKQLMDAVLRIVSLQSFQIISQLLKTVPDDSTDPIRRMRSVLGKLVWKRNQLALAPVQTEWSDGPVWETLRKEPLFALVGQSTTTTEATEKSDEARDDELLVRYVQHLHKTELQLRNLVLQHLTDVPVAIIATAADERKGSMESMDEADFDDQVSSGIVWRSSGHKLLNKFIFRPEETENTDDLTPCYWYRLESFSESVVGEAEQGDSAAQGERSEIGNAKEAPLVERRVRFQAVPQWTGPVDASGYAKTYSTAGSTTLILTEAQARAGLKAGEIQKMLESSSEDHENPFATRTSKITLYPTDLPHANVPRHMIVVGHDSVTTGDNVVRHRILVLPETTASSEGQQDAAWVDMETATDGKMYCKLPEESVLYTVQQSDYHSDSPAFRECLGIVNYLERSPKAAPFLEPVDPVALNIPGYFDVIKNPMDISTVAKKLEMGHYSNIPPSQTVGRSPIARMLNGPFRKDVELIFDNAMLFNLPTEWIHQAAATLKKSVLKKIDQISSHAEAKYQSPSKQKKSIYVDEDSDVDLYVDESDGDDDYDAAGRKRRKRKRQQRQAIKEDSAARAVERPIRLQNVLSDSMGLRGHFANLPVRSEAASFALPPEWSCRYKTETASVAVSEEPVVEKSDEDKELDELIALQQQTVETEAASYRRSTRHHPTGAAASKAVSITGGLEYFRTETSRWNEDDETLPGNRLEVELARERDHERIFAKMYYEAKKRQAKTVGADRFGQYAENSFPPYLGRVIPLECPVGDGATWEIRSAFVVPALRWVIRGLIHSGHLSQVEELTSDNINSGVVLANNAYYWDSDLEPFEVLDQKEMQRRKRANQEDAAEESEEEIELSEYEKMRAARVARNAERLKALGLA